MEETTNPPFERFKARLDVFEQDEREKILSLASKLLLKEGYTEEKAIGEAIEKAKIWFHDKDK